jgi:hypothetical protein
MSRIAVTLRGRVDWLGNETVLSSCARSMILEYTVETVEVNSTGREFDGFELEFNRFQTRNYV